MALAACEAPQSAIDPEGIWAERPHTLFLVVLAIAAVVFVLVMGLIVYSVWRFRERDGDDEHELPVQVHGNTALELTWTIIPALILAGIAVPTVQLIFELEDRDEDALEIEVIGHRWWWEYRYEVPDGVGDTNEVLTANELVIPEGVEVRLAMTAEELGSAENAVLHSYWVPQLAGKKDVVPGRTNFLRINAPVTGEETTYLGQCAEYCGLSHANMRNRVVALPQGDFDAWLANQASTPEQPAEGTPERRGYDLVMSNTCVGCHAIRGSEAQGITGPNLTHFASRATFAGAIYDTADREQLEAWILNAPAEKAMHPDQTPSIGMPGFVGQLTEQDVSDIADYLYSLE